jgi:hypothetical protein
LPTKRQRFVRVEKKNRTQPYAVYKKPTLIIKTDRFEVKGRRKIDK